MVLSRSQEWKWGEQDPQVVDIDDPNTNVQDVPPPIQPKPPDQNEFPTHIVPEAQQPEAPPVTPEPVPPPQAMEASVPSLRCSTRVQTEPSSCIPTMSGIKHDCVATQIAHDVLHPDAHMFAQDDFCQAEPDAVTTIMTQLSLRAGLKMWGDQGHKAAHAEMKQLHMQDMFLLKHWSELNPLQKVTILELHMFLKEKRDKMVKGHAATGGNKQ